MEKKTFDEWSSIHTSPPPPKTYTEEEYLAIKKRGEFPFYQLKDIFPDIIYNEGIYIIEGFRFQRSFLDGIDEYQNLQISLRTMTSHDSSVFGPIVNNRDDFLKAIDWLKNEWPKKQEENRHSDRAWRAYNSLIPFRRLFFDVFGI